MCIALVHIAVCNCQAEAMSNNEKIKLIIPVVIGLHLSEGIKVSKAVSQ